MSAAPKIQNHVASGADRVPEPPAPGERGKFRRVERAPERLATAPLVGVEVDFDQEQSAWLREEAARTGLDYVALVRRLVDHARGRAVNPE
jgi:hypothetical protein